MIPGIFQVEEGQGTPMAPGEPVCPRRLADLPRAREGDDWMGPKESLDPASQAMSQDHHPKWHIEISVDLTEFSRSVFARPACPQNP
jgi:hypothetical protein